MAAPAAPAESAPAESAPVQVAARPPAPAAAPAPRVSAAEGVDVSVGFPSGGADLDDASREQLKALLPKIKADSTLQVRLLAYASDTGGSASAARRLSLERALVVRKFLMFEGVQSTRMAVRALGAQVPSGNGDRVDIIIVAP